MPTTTDRQDDIFAPSDDPRASIAQLFEQSPSFMAFLSSPNHRVEYVNPEYMKLIDHRSVIGRTVSEALGEALGPAHIEMLDRVYATGDAHRAEGARYVENPKPGDNERYVDVVYQPIRDAHGHVSGIFVQGVEVTERVQDDYRRRALERSTTAIRDIQDPIASSQAEGASQAEVRLSSRAGGVA